MCNQCRAKVISWPFIKGKIGLVMARVDVEDIDVKAGMIGLVFCNDPFIWWNPNGAYGGEDGLYDAAHNVYITDSYELCKIARAYGWRGYDIVRWIKHRAAQKMLLPCYPESEPGIGSDVSLWSLDYCRRMVRVGQKWDRLALKKLARLDKLEAFILTPGLVEAAKQKCRDAIVKCGFDWYPFGRESEIHNNKDFVTFCWYEVRYKEVMWDNVAHKFYLPERTDG